jgi:hypothetical protein
MWQVRLFIILKVCLYYIYFSRPVLALNGIRIKNIYKKIMEQISEMFLLFD